MRAASPRMSNTLRAFIVAAGFCALPACSTLSQVAPGSASNQIALGDRLDIVRRDGSKLSLTVDALDEKAIAGAGVRIERDDLVRVERREFSGTRTVLLTGAVTAGIYILLYGLGILALLAVAL